MDGLLGMHPNGRPRTWLLHHISGHPNRLVAALAFFALAPLLVLAYFSIDIATRSATTAAQSRLIATTSLGAAYVQREMSGLTDVVGVYAREQTLVAAAADGNYLNYRTADMIPLLVDLQRSLPAGCLNSWDSA